MLRGGGFTNTNHQPAHSPARGDADSSPASAVEPSPHGSAAPLYAGLRVTFGTGESLADILARAANRNVVVRYIDARKSRIVVRGVQILDGMWLTGLRGVPGSGVFHFSADSARSRYCVLCREFPGGAS